MRLPPYNIFPEISGDRISLRQVQLSDLSDLIEICFYDSVQASSLQQAGEMQEKINTDYMQGNTVHWGIADKATNKILGTCGYYRGFDDGAGELGCVLLPEFQSQGFMKEAMELAIEFGLQNMGLQRIWAVTTTENVQALRLLDRLGFEEVRKLTGDEIEYELKKE